MALLGHIQFTFLVVVREGGAQVYPSTTQSTANAHLSVTRQSFKNGCVCVCGGGGGGGGGGSEENNRIDHQFECMNVCI